MIFFALLFALGSTPDLGRPTAGAPNDLVAREAATKGTYATRGVIKSFGAGKSYVNIAHEDIPGYMAAMTMAFEPRTQAQLANLAVGDAVSLTFTETDDGRRLIDTIQKR